MCKTLIQLIAFWLASAGWCYPCIPLRVTVRAFRAIILFFILLTQAGCVYEPGNSNEPTSPLSIQGPSGNGEGFAGFIQAVGGHRLFAVQKDGKYVLAAPLTEILDYSAKLTLVRYELNFLLDLSFGNQAFQPTNIFSKGLVGNAIAIQSDQKILVAGFSMASKVAAQVERYLTDGRLDLGFGVQGTADTRLNGEATRANALALQRDGKIVAAG